MRMPPIRITLGVALVLIASAVLAHSTLAPASLTGAPAVAGVAAEGKCNACHSGGVTARVEILGAPDFYAPDSVYNLTVRLTTGTSGPTRGGFQITAVRKADGQGVGTFDVTGGNGITIISGAGPFASRSYVAPTAPRSGTPSAEWTFRWRAPSTDRGPVYFFATGLSANSNGSNSGDLTVFARDSTESNAVLDAPGPSSGRGNRLLPPSPNPMRDSNLIRFVLTRSATAELSIVDAQGREVRTLLSGAQPAGESAIRWDARGADGTQVRPGAYWARLRISGAPPLPAQRIVLTR